MNAPLFQSPSPPSSSSSSHGNTLPSASPPQAYHDRHVTFRIRLIDADYVVESPLPTIDSTLASSSLGPDDTSSPFYPLQAFSLATAPAWRRRVPVVRIFGRTPAGQAACVHVHGVYPYLLIPLDDLVRDPEVAGLQCFNAVPSTPTSQASQPKQPERVCAVARQLAAALDTALASSYNASSSSHTQPTTRSSTTSGAFVHGVQVVQAKPFYGYTPRSCAFAKLFLYNPAHVTRAAALLNNGVVLGRKLQPHEAHIPYLLHFLIDYNLFGMSYVDFSAVAFRRPLPTQPFPQTLTEPAVPRTEIQPEAHSQGFAFAAPSSSLPPLSQRTWTKRTTPVHLLSSIQVTKSTTTQLELDASATCILNRLRSVSLDALPAVEREDDSQLVRSLASMWESERRRKEQLAEELGEEDDDDPDDDEPHLAANAPLPRSRIQQIYHERLARVAAMENQLQPLPDTASAPAPDGSTNNFLSHALTGALAVLQPKRNASQPDAFYTPVQDRASMSPSSPWSQLTPGDTAVGQALLSLLDDDSKLLHQFDEVADDEDTDDDTERQQQASQEEVDAILQSTQTQDADDMDLILQLLSPSPTKRSSQPPTPPQPPSPPPPPSFTTPEPVPSRREKKRYHLKEILRKRERTPGKVEYFVEVQRGHSTRQLWVKPRHLSKRPDAVAEFERREAERVRQRDSDSDVDMTPPPANVVDLCSPEQQPRTPPAAQRDIGALWNHAYMLQPTQPPPSATAVVAQVEPPPRRTKRRAERTQPDPPDEADSSDDGEDELDRPPDADPGNTPVRPSSPKYDESYLDTSMYLPKPSQPETPAFQRMPALFQSPFAATLPPKTPAPAAAAASTDSPPRKRSTATRSSKFKLRRKKRTVTYGKNPTSPIKSVSPASLQTPSPPSWSVPATHSRLISPPTPASSASPFAFKQDMQHTIHDGSWQKEEQTVSSYGDDDHFQNLTLVALEVHVNTRRNLLPDPVKDAVQAIIFTVRREIGPRVIDMPGMLVLVSQDEFEQHERDPSKLSGPSLPSRGPPELRSMLLPEVAHVELFASEESMISAFVRIVQRHDPDMVLGFELQKQSLGYLIDRAEHAFGRDLCSELSRTPTAEELSALQMTEEERAAAKGAQDEAQAAAAKLWGDLDAAGGGSSSSAAAAAAAAAAAEQPPSIYRNDKPRDSTHHAAEAYGKRKASGITLPGRIVLNIWRIVRSEVRLPIYSLERVVAHVLGVRIPFFSHESLTKWFNGNGDTSSRFATWRWRWRCLEHHMMRCYSTLVLVDKLELIARKSEFARVYGIRFFSVISRGSQYRVESMLARMTRALHYALVSPSRLQVGNQAAMECVPLVMEPESNFYTDPVIVLDFRSLYPSIMIAYNICYCTCLGRVPSESLVKKQEQGMDVDEGDGASSAHGSKPLGVSTLEVNSDMLRDLAEHIWISPNGVMFARRNVRRGVLSRLLHEILETRFMVKRAMKDPHVAANSTLLRVLNARQMGLKMIANVTYGYTSAGFSGRMPCAEIADSIVQTGRQTLESTIQYINAHPRWGAHVVYGDTDSVFVRLPGRSRAQAFEVGREIAAEVTARNPQPVMLQMEKVYQPCFLMSKKRYVGWKFETGAPDEQGVFDAKGIETVRRDSCPAVSKTLEKSMRLIFTQPDDLARVRRYLERQWTKILRGVTSIEDFVFAKEVKLGRYSVNGTLPPAAIVSTKRMNLDRRSEPLYGERVRYVVVEGAPGSRLIDLVVPPEEIVQRQQQQQHQRGGRDSSAAQSLRINARYYIAKQIIPALERAFGLVPGASITQWFASMPRPRRVRMLPVSAESGRARLPPMSAPTGSLHRVSATIEHYYLSRHCPICDGMMRGESPVCDVCAANAPVTMLVLTHRHKHSEQRLHALYELCHHCTRSRQQSTVVSSHCCNLDCPNLYRRSLAHVQYDHAHALLQATTRTLDW